jgi:hypothetical protein
MMSGKGEIRVAHASRVLVSASRRNRLSFGFCSQREVNLQQSSRTRDGFASTRDACATQPAANTRELCQSTVRKVHCAIS